MEQKLIQSIQQSTKMTHALSQSIQLLQLNGLELMAYINEVMEENPLIDEIEPPFDYVVTNTNVSQHINGDIDTTESKIESMYDQLKQQVGLLRIDKQLLKVVLYGIDCLDDNGYLAITLEEWAGKYTSSIKMVENALTIIQSLDPKGVGARNLKECLVLQVKDDNLDGTILVDLITDHLKWIAQQELELIADTYEIDRKTAERLIEKVKRCNPKPAQLLNQEPVVNIVPDAEIKKEKNEWKIIINKWNSPKIHLNGMYRDFKDTDKETDTFLRDKHQQVKWLLHTLDYRKLQMEQVLQLLLVEQFSFFENGSFSMKPLKLKDIATQLNVNISTVSRMFKNKYVQTPYGTFPFHFFLQTGLVNKEGDVSSAYTIKQLLRTMINEEDKKKPLADETIRQILAENHNIKISRRTIAKYRTSMKILASIERKNR
ncbi:RNA polymerase factor sigma-54 [Paraliobacillus zengyii]|uniref:RNA polymerase factor sigma-54 n=1 Tax=Paraliobacillus zengyii TaxID=2213194 RepID=UPI000E3E10FB|nr:RNA polymerase factor sigma-54 [Paraliobacillus zengyii]